MKHFLLTILLLMMPTSNLFAGVIKGKIVDQDKQPLEFVNVAVYQMDSDTPFKGTITDENGSFLIDGVKDATYSVRITFMGYESLVRNVTLGADNQHTANLRTLTMHEDRAVLQDVVVATQKAAMKLDIDKKVFDVSQSITTAGLSASEALENIPSVEVDQDGNISLRGSSSVTIWINGKAQGLTSDNRGDILQQLPAESIERIEVITNPSSKYSPEGSAGIINIILKRDRKAGYYGGVQLNMGKTPHVDPSGRLGANINYSSGLLEAYANIGVGRRVRTSEGFSDRDFINPDADNYHYGYLNTKSHGGGKGLNLFGRAGLTWHITPKDEVGINYMGMVALKKGTRDSHYFYEQGLYFDEDGLWSNYVDRLLNYTSFRNSHNSDRPQMNNASLTYRHEWKTNHTLDVNLSYGTWNGNQEVGHNQFTFNRFYAVNYDVYGESCPLIAIPQAQLVCAILPDEESTQWQETEFRNYHYEAQIDYVQPLIGSAKIEAGYKGNWSHENSPTETWTSQDKSQSIYSLFNRFIYDQAIQALYFNYQNRIGEKFGYQLGLRGEYWTVQTESYNYDQEYNTNHLTGVSPLPKYTNDFFKLFPTVFLSYQLPHDQEMQLNYTRRLSRPWGGQLNSFKNINDATSISYGNPSLTPAYTNSFELNYIKNWEEHTLSVSSYYRPSSDVMQRVSYLQDGILYSTNENIAKEQSSGLEIIGKNKVFKVIDLTTTVNAFYYKLDGGDFNIFDQGASHFVHVDSDKDFSWNASVMAQLTLPWQLAFQTTGRYNAAKVIAQGKRYSDYRLDMGLRRSFFDKRLTVNLNARNILDSRKNRSRTHVMGTPSDGVNSWRPGYIQLSENRWGGRRFGIQISYSFGNMRVRERGGRGEGGPEETPEGVGQQGGRGDRGGRRGGDNNSKESFGDGSEE